MTAFLSGDGIWRFVGCDKELRGSNAVICWLEIPVPPVVKDAFIRKLDWLNRSVCSKISQDEAARNLVARVFGDSD
jgi:hypothetical protein